MSEPTDDKIVWYDNHPKRSSIKSFTTQELVAELSSRETVNLIYSSEYHWYEIKLQHENDWHSIKGEGSATILVIKS
jgi:hypothetical protein